MDIHLTNNFLLAGTYIAYIIWTALVAALLFSSFKRNWGLTKRILKYALNTGVFIIAWMFILELALIVRPAIYESEQASSIALKSWIKEYQIKDIYIALGVIAILVGINLLFHFKVEEKRIHSTNPIVTYWIEQRNFAVAVGLSHLFYDR
jgi:hypothetical protein